MKKYMSILLALLMLAVLIPGCAAAELWRRTCLRRRRPKGRVQRRRGEAPGKGWGQEPSYVKGEAGRAVRERSLRGETSYICK